MNGFVNLIKPEGMSSAYAVGLVKKKFNSPAGHMGTLDPMASGVLPIGLNHASRLFPYILDKEKTYVANFKFGVLTDTLDTTGKITDTCSFIPTKKKIEEKLRDFIGEINQIPPKYSAKCVDGKRGYELARKGVEFDLQPKKVTVLSFELLDGVGENEYSFRIKCKGGTYIRSLARDLGLSTGSLAVMSKLDRVQSGIFDYSNGVTYDTLLKAKSVEEFIIPSDSVLSFDKLVLSNERATKMLNGVYEKYGFDDGVYRVYNEREFWGVGTVKDGILKMNSYVR